MGGVEGVVGGFVGTVLGAGRRDSVTGGYGWVGGNTGEGSDVIFKGQQVGSLSFAGRFRENPKRLRQRKCVTRLRIVTAYSVIGFSRPDSIGA